MTVTQQKTSVEELRLSTLPDRSHLELSFVYTPEDVEKLHFAKSSIFVDGYTIAPDVQDNNRISISAKTAFMRSGVADRVDLNRAVIDDHLVVGQPVEFTQERRGGKTFESTLYVAGIKTTSPKPPRSIDLFSLPAGTVVQVRSASLETAIFITGEQPLREQPAMLPVFTSSIPAFGDAAAYPIPVQRFVIEGERFGRMSKVLEAHIVRC